MAVLISDASAVICHAILCCMESVDIENPLTPFLRPAATTTWRKGQKMSKTVKNFTVNYNGEVVKPGEVMVPFPYAEGDAENCINPECIKTVKQGGRCFKVIYKAIPEQWAKVGNSALNLIQNEVLGHYNIPNSVSMDAMRDEYELELDKALSAEAVALEKEDLDETLNTFVELVQRVIEKSAKIGYAILLMHTGIKGEEFYGRMKLSHNPANLVQRQAESILHSGLANLDVNSIRCYKSQHEEEYRKEAYKLLEEIVKMYQ